jgi:dihydrodipicolinate synthase/N-acetylneuraminate lyase
MHLQLDDYRRRCRPGRTVQGISAVLLPYGSDGRIDEIGFRRHLERTLKSGLRAAVNMDTGYVDLLTAEEKGRVLKWSAETIGGRDWFAAGALPVSGDPSLPLVKAYIKECSVICGSGGVPVIFPSPGYAKLDESGLLDLFREIAANVGSFIGFELGKMFSPNGRMFPEKVLARLMELPACRGLKHSSLDRNTELNRIELRDRLRPDFVIYSGNDLAADMIEYGSDYLLGLSTFTPELFAARDLAWKDNQATYLELRDFIQYLGWIGFREPVPAYKHSAAIFLKLTGGLETSEPHPRAARREAWDYALLADAAKRLEQILQTDSRRPA